MPSAAISYAANIPICARVQIKARLNVNKFKTIEPCIIKVIKLAREMVDSGTIAGAKITTSDGYVNLKRIDGKVIVQREARHGY